MAKEKKYIVNIPESITIEELIRYAEGRLSSRENHSIEKYLLEHPFEAEALEGILLLEKPALAMVYAQKIEKAVFAKEKNKNVLWWWAVAASFLLLFGLFFFPSIPTDHITSSKVVEQDDSLLQAQTVDTIVQYLDTNPQVYHEEVQTTVDTKEYKTTQQPIGVERVAKEEKRNVPNVKQTHEDEIVVVLEEMEVEENVFGVVTRSSKDEEFDDMLFLSDKSLGVQVDDSLTNYDSLISEMLVMIDIDMQGTALYNTNAIEMVEDNSLNDAKEITDVAPNTIPKKEEPFITQQAHKIKENNKRLTYAKKAKSKAKKSLGKPKRKLGSSSEAKSLSPQKDMISEEIALNDKGSVIPQKADVPLYDSIVQKEVPVDELLLKEEFVQKSNNFQFEAVRKLIENKKYDEAMRNLAAMNQAEEKTRWLKAITHFGKGEAEDGVKQLLYIIQADQDTPITKKAREILRKLK